MFFPGDKNIRKEYTPGRKSIASGKDISFYLFGIKKGSLTLETAVVLPWFLFAMLAILQFAQINNMAVSVLSGAHQTVKEMAVYAYVKEMGISAGEGAAADLVTGGISAAYAGGEIRKRSGVSSENGKLSLLQSSFMKDDILDAVVTIQPSHTYTLLPIGAQKGLVRARVRAWTGREGSGSSGGKESSGGETSHKVYVAEHGTVYHTDPNCSHIRLSIQSVPKEKVAALRNVNGGKYHVCEKCGAGAGGMVYISPYGDKYHSSLECSGLKRTVEEVEADAIGNLRPCSKCGGG